MKPLASYAASYRLVLDESAGTSMKLVGIVSETGAEVISFTAHQVEDNIIVEFTANTTGSENRREIVEILQALPGVKVDLVTDATFQAHSGGKISVEPKTPIHDRSDLSRVYTPGVARVCQSIFDTPMKSRELTIRKNTVAIVTDGSAVLGLGDIGPEAALPVMEGKAVLFKQFGGVDAWPIVLGTKDTDEIVSIVKAISPGFGGINLEDIAAPRCFEIEARLKEELDIPVFHDDQHGTAIVVLAALINALKVVDKKIENCRIVVSGVGAAGTAIIKLLLAQGATDIVGYGRGGAVNLSNTDDSNPARRELAEITNPRGVDGSLIEGLKDADVFIGVSHANLFSPADIASMADNPIVFALANPDPEIDPIGAAEYAAIVATGRSDLPNQINNVLAFPGLFRGLLDERVSEITPELLKASANAIASVVPEEERSATNIIPEVFDPRVAFAVKEAVAQVSVKVPHFEVPTQEHLQ